MPLSKVPTFISSYSSFCAPANNILNQHFFPAVCVDLLCFIELSFEVT